ncbi:MAG: hypothetical protein U0795_18745 [Pirellulales bacterium]
MNWLRVGLLLSLLGSLVGSVRAGEPATKPDFVGQLQGHWKVVSNYGPSGDGPRLPDEAQMNSLNRVLSVDQNMVSAAGHPVLALTTDLPLPAEEQKVGLNGNRLVMLTLPDGRGLLCSAHVRDDNWEIAYPHTTSCHRGSGQIIVLQRVKNNPQTTD